MKLYKFHWGVHRMGDLRGVFLAEPEDVASAIGRGVYFGEVLGKHSEIEGTLDVGDVTEIECSAEFVAEFATLFPRGFDWNPLRYIKDKCSSCGHEERPGCMSSPDGSKLVCEDCEIESGDAARAEDCAPSSTS